MTYRHFLAALILALAILPAFAQQIIIEHQPVGCLPARQHGVLFATSQAPGDARLYYRRSGASEWCYVEGVRFGNNIRAILPQFEPDIEIEHFFITLREGEVTSRSPRIYRVRVKNQCETLVARGVDFLLSACEDQPGEIGSAIAAGYAIKATGEPPEPTPFSPE